MGIILEVFCGHAARFRTAPRLRLWNSKGSLWRYRAYTLSNSILDFIPTIFSIVLVGFAKFKKCDSNAGQLDSSAFCGGFYTYECSNASYTFMLGVPMVVSTVVGSRMLVRCLWVYLASSIQNKVQFDIVDNSKLRKRIRRVMGLLKIITLLVGLEVIILGSYAIIIGLDKCRDRFNTYGQRLVKKCRWEHLNCVQGFMTRPTWQISTMTTNTQITQWTLVEDVPLSEPDKSWSSCNEKEFLYEFARYWDQPALFEDSLMYSFLFTVEWDRWFFQSFECPEMDMGYLELCDSSCTNRRISNDPPLAAMQFWEEKFLDQTGRISYYRLVHQTYLFSLGYFFVLRLLAFIFVAVNTVPDALYASIPPIDESIQAKIFRLFSPTGWSSLGD